MADQAAAKLASYGRPTAVSFWHEPNMRPDPGGPRCGQKQILPFFKRGELRVGPILNGWLLDNQVEEFEAYIPDEMFGHLGLGGHRHLRGRYGVQPRARKPADRIHALRSYLSSRGYDHPIGVGEYNGFSAATIAAAGEALLSTPNVWFGCLWNSAGDVPGARGRPAGRVPGDPRRPAERRARLIASSRRGSSALPRQARSAGGRGAPERRAERAQAQRGAP